MTKGNDIKKELLGIPYGTACAILRKNIMFWLAGKNGMLNCFKCGKPIENIADFSIEHKLPWQKQLKPNEAFFNIENIAFSHLRCNSGSHNRLKTHCPKGHKYNAIRKNGDKFCRICHREVDKKNPRNHDKKKRHDKYIKYGY
jgi:hypothetical protein